MKKVVLGILVMGGMLFSACSSSDSGSPSVTDVNGNSYKIVTIGTQTWTAENLNVTKYRNGDPIPEVQDPTAWAALTTGAWCYYANDTANGTVYGKMYNWYAVNDPRGLAPEGWHIPNQTEWNTLFTTLGSTSTAGGAMKETGTSHWTDPNTGATNTSGFTALPGGYRIDIGTPKNLGISGSFWSATPFDSDNAYLCGTKNSNTIAALYSFSKKEGCSIRCVKDETVSDVDGNSYKVVPIDTQKWTQTNLNVSKYTDGTAIPQVTDQAAWAALTTGAWCYYSNDTANGPVYGKLYNWYAVAGIYDAASLADATKRKKLAPTGYHVPSDAEWTTLYTFLGDESVAGDKMKATTGWTPYSGITNTNSSGFTGLPGGYRNYDGTFYDIGNYGLWWSSSEFSPTDAWHRDLHYDSSVAFNFIDSKTLGFSVRCLRD